MSNPHVLRLLVFAASGVVALWLFFSLAGWLAVAAPLGVFLLGGIVSEMLFKRFATPTQKIADLADRVRNPPL